MVAGVAVWALGFEPIGQLVPLTEDRSDVSGGMWRRADEISLRMWLDRHEPLPLGVRDKVGDELRVTAGERAGLVVKRER